MPYVCTIDIYLISSLVLLFSVGFFSTQFVCNLSIIIWVFFPTSPFPVIFLLLSFPGGPCTHPSLAVRPGQDVQPYKVIEIKWHTFHQSVTNWKCFSIKCFSYGTFSSLLCLFDVVVSGGVHPLTISLNFFTIFPEVNLETFCLILMNENLPRHICGWFISC